MSDWLMLVCSVLCSLAIGVLAAYGVCLGFFAMFRMPAREVVQEPVVQASGAPSVVGG